MHMCDVSCACVMYVICCICYALCDMSCVRDVMCVMTMCDLCVILVNVICVMHVCEVCVRHVWSPVQPPTQDLASVMHICVICCNMMAGLLGFLSRPAPQQPASNKENHT